MKGRVNRFAAMVAAAFLVGWLHGPVLAEQRQVPEDIAEIKLSFAPIVKRVAPAVVNVYASRVVQQQSPFLDDPFFRRFFGGRNFGGPTQRVQRSLGSGVIIDASGIIVTNHHVIAKASEIKVALADRREFDCDVILTDERTDLAVLRIRDFDGTLPFLEPSLIPTSLKSVIWSWRSATPSASDRR